MDRQDNGEGGRWDVGAKGKAVYLERRGEDDQQVFSDRLEPEEARKLASLLNKFADKAASADEGEAAQDDDSDDEGDSSQDDASDGESDRSDGDSDDESDRD